MHCALATANLPPPAPSSHPHNCHRKADHVGNVKQEEIVVGRAGQEGWRAGGQCDIILQWSGNTGTMGDGPASCLTHVTTQSVFVT